MLKGCTVRALLMLVYYRYISDITWTIVSFIAIISGAIYRPTEVVIVTELASGKVKGDTEPTLS